MRAALDACEPHRGRVQPGLGPVQRRAAAREWRFQRVRAAAWRVSVAPSPVRAGRCPVPAAPWRVRVYPCHVSITPRACVSRGLGVCEMTLGACQSSLGACRERLGISHLRQITSIVPRKAVRTGKTAGPANVADPLPDLRSFTPGSTTTIFTNFIVSMPTRTISPGRFIHLAGKPMLACGALHPRCRRCFIFGPSTS